MFCFVTISQWKNCTDIKNHIQVQQKKNTVFTYNLK